MKRCSKCDETKEFNLFGNDKSSKDGKTHWCKACKRTSTKKWEDQNQEKKKLICKVWLTTNKERSRENHKAWREKNYSLWRPKATERARKNSKLRYFKDIQFKLQKNLRSRLNHAVKSSVKVGSAIDDLGCSIEELKAYLESKFQPGMTWDNHGVKGWHIDHIKPLSKFDLTKEEQLKEACHYTNLQPLWSKDNLSKSSK